jgi:hypothetical protein
VKGGFAGDGSQNKRFRPATFDERDAKGILVPSALFFFPSKTASGEPTIANDEKSVEFNCNMDGSSLRVNFEPQRMVDQTGLSLECLTPQLRRGNFTPFRLRGPLDDANSSLLSFIMTDQF